MSFEPGAPRGAALIPLSEPVLSGNEWLYVKECLDTGWVSSAGPFVARLEQWAVDHLECAAAVAVTSGTAALHVGLLLAGVRPGDAVVVPSLTFIAPANAVTYVGARPLFVDAEAEHLQLDPLALRAFLECDCRTEGGRVRHRVTGRRVAAVIAVHVLGHPCDMDELRAVAGDFGLPVIEDATESLGSRYRGRPVGALAGLGCLSFNGNKI
ncbi:MAG: DegT/DnrJ/EryC1/StrS family aminotransferase, partial [Thermoleophilia bacterium]